jgi:peptide/nickel transport system permease protein
LTYLVRRLWQFVPTLLGVVLLVFFLFNWVGGDPAYLLAGKIANPELIENIRRSLGVDQPYWVQLWIFIKQVLTADFGASWSTNERVSQIFATRLGPSLTVLVPLLLISTFIALAAAMLVAYYRGSLTDRAIMVGCTVGQSVSILVYILVLQYFLAYQLGWFPVQGWGATLGENLLRYAALPVLVAWWFRSRPTSACTAAFSSMRSGRIMCAPRAPRAWARGACFGCTCCATPPSRC